MNAKMNNAEMDPELKARWVAALRSGKYEQAKGRLRRYERFCCLGVLCDVVDPKGWDEQTSLIWQGFDVYVPDDFLSQDIQEGLVKLNDEGVDFAKIADFIEKSSW